MDKAKPPRIITGIFKISVSSLIAESDYRLVKLVYGSQSSQTQTKEIQQKPYFLFEGCSDQKLQIYLYPPSEKDTEIGYGEVLLTPLSKLPGFLHVVTVNTVRMTGQKLIINQRKAALKLQIFYYEKFEQVIKIKVVSGNLLRDTQAFGKMDPYVILRMGEQEFRTQTLASAGKFPKWNEQFEFKSRSPLDQIEVIVNDSDFARDDNIGSAVLKLGQEGYFKPKNKCTIDLFYEGKKSGTLDIQTYFTFTIKKT